jgi:hypothetical protein
LILQPLVYDSGDERNLPVGCSHPSRIRHTLAAM